MNLQDEHVCAAQQNTEGSEFEIGDIVILFALENKWGRGFRVDHHHEQHIRAIDNVFHALDGQGAANNQAHSQLNW